MYLQLWGHDAGGVLEVDLPAAHATAALDEFYHDLHWECRCVWVNAMVWTCCEQCSAANCCTSYTSANSVFMTHILTLVGSNKQWSFAALNTFICYVWWTVKRCLSCNYACMRVVQSLQRWRRGNDAPCRALQPMEQTS